MSLVRFVSLPYIIVTFFKNFNCMFLMTFSIEAKNFNPVFMFLGMENVEWRQYCGITDPMIREACFEMEILRCINVGLLCVQEFVVNRPTVSIVISMLKSETLDLPQPKQPAFIERQLLQMLGPLNTTKVNAPLTMFLLQWFKANS